MPYKDEEDRRRYQAEYGKSRDPSTRSGATHQDVVERNLRLIREKKRTECADCGVRYRPYVMRLYAPELERKGANIFKQRPSGPMFQLLWELGQAEVVCANCKAERDHRRELEERAVRERLEEMEDQDGVAS